MLFNTLLNILREPSKKSIDEDQMNRLRIDNNIMVKKPELLKVVYDIQEIMIRAAANSEFKGGLNLELGAGVLPMKKNFSEVKSTDIVPSAHLDGILDATNLQLDDNSTNSLFLQNTFHHLPDPQAFFAEAVRVLKNGGRVVIVDPYFNRLSSALYPVLFKTETFEKKGDWFGASSHAMIGANQALSYIVFERDISQFIKNNQNLKLIHSGPLYSGLRYLLTGGLNFRKLAPDVFLRALRILEINGMMPKFFSLHWIIVLEKADVT